MKLRTLLLGLILAACPAPRLPAAMPDHVAVAGRLEDPVGVPMSGPVSLAIRVYDAEAGGSPLHTETDAVTLDELGRFSTALGDSTTLPAGLFPGERWVSFEVDGGGELAPRERLHAVPFAGYAARGGFHQHRVELAHHGDDAAAGQRLRDTVAGIVGATAAAPWVIRLAPGRWDIGATTLELPDHVGLQGWGAAVTRLERSGGDGGALVLGDGCHLSDLEVEGPNKALGLDRPGHVAVRRCRLVAVQPIDYYHAVIRSVATSLTLEDSRVEGAGFPGRAVDGVRMKVEPSAPQTLEVRRCHVRITQDAVNAGRAFHVDELATPVVLRDVRIEVSNATGRVEAYRHTLGTAESILDRCRIVADGVGGSEALDANGGTIRVSRSWIGGSVTAGVCGAANADGDGDPLAVVACTP